MQNSSLLTLTVCIFISLCVFLSLGKTIKLFSTESKSTEYLHSNKDFLKLYEFFTLWKIILPICFKVVSKFDILLIMATNTLKMSAQSQGIFAFFLLQYLYYSVCLSAPYFLLTFVFWSLYLSSFHLHSYVHWFLLL